LPKIRPMMENNGHNRVSLTRLIQSHPELTLSIEAQRSYGEFIDKILDRYRKRSYISARYGTDSKGHIRMLLADRFDYLIECPPVFLYALRENHTTMENLCSFEIAESRTFQPASIGCSKTASGKAIIDRINAILREERKSDTFRQNIERWLDTDTLPAFREAYKTFLLAD
jgi:uncharacterized protein (TIGR02285 family)